METGQRTGRSPHDKYVVTIHQLFMIKVAWGKVNQPASREQFEKVYQAIIQHFQDKDLYIFDGYAGANPK